MSEAVTQILARLDGFSQRERADLAYAFLCSLEPEDEGVAEAWDAELSRRVAEIRSGQAVGKPAEQLFAELREKAPVKPIIFHREAEAELRAAIAYYEEQRQGLGEEFREEVERGTARIARMPHSFSLYGKEGLRRHVLRRFPYSIFYLELAESIWVAAVAHQRRRPGYWADRSPE